MYELTLSLSAQVVNKSNSSFKCLFNNIQLIGSIFAIKSSPYEIIRHRLNKLLDVSSSAMTLYSVIIV